MAFFVKLSKDYGLDIGLLYWFREYEDGVTFFEFILNYDKYEEDHSPRFEFVLYILNLCIFDFTIYYLHHRSNNGANSGL